MGIQIEFCAVSEATEDCAKILTDAGIGIAVGSAYTEHNPPHGRKVKAYEASIRNGSAALTPEQLEVGDLHGKPVTGYGEEIETSVLTLSKNFLAAASNGGGVAVFDVVQGGYTRVRVAQYSEDKGLKFVGGEIRDGEAVVAPYKAYAWEHNA